MADWFPPAFRWFIYALINHRLFSVPALFLAWCHPWLFLAVALSVYVYFLPGFHSRPFKSKTAMKGTLEKPFVKAFWFHCSLRIHVGLNSWPVSLRQRKPLLCCALCFVRQVCFSLKSLKYQTCLALSPSKCATPLWFRFRNGVVAAANWLLTFSRVPQTVSPKWY